MRPRLLDLFCGAGGASMGYHRAGFEVVGVDVRPQPRYPFSFIQGDALQLLAAIGRRFDAIHASPPCIGYTSARIRTATTEAPLLIPVTRQLLQLVGRPWVIENVATRQTGLTAHLRLCACQFGMPELKRERWFETWPAIYDLRPPCYHPLPSISVLRRAGRIWAQGGVIDDYVPLARCKQVMGIDWMTQRELGNAIPPSYTEYIGRHLMEVISDGAGSASDPGPAVVGV